MFVAALAEPAATIAAANTIVLTCFMVDTPDPFFW
ncbi:hypothetical protein SAHL_01860 [Salinisphaera orenii YIM 95161]|uniref:Uncharacterized protein n=1 Tax=Salinisphaera orenii YIM 95161 TaxID=1051139 RepID=A0A423Q930_9GAMM|nr:hypothetical protein SAHL_01860 [Salinisphaera halophila YIM 95161]